MVRPERFELRAFWFGVGEVNLVNCELSCPYKFSNGSMQRFLDGFCSLYVPNF